MNEGKEEYRELVEQFRHHYLTKFGIRLEDDMIYLFIRINEMHLDLRKEIENLKSPKETTKPTLFYSIIKFFKKYLFQS